MSSKTLLLVDAVPWGPEYPAAHPLKSVRGWFSAALGEIRGVVLRDLPARRAEEALTDPGLSGVLLSGSPLDAWSDDPVNTGLCRFCTGCPA